METGEVIRGYNTIIEVRGHAAKKAWPSDCFYKGARDLSYERAKSVSRELVQNGVQLLPSLREAPGPMLGRPGRESNIDSMNTVS